MILSDVQLKIPGKVYKVLASGEKGHSGSGKKGQLVVG